MGKAKKTKPSQIGQKVPLDQQIEETRFAKSKNRNKIRVRKDDDEQFVDPSLSRKILSTAREQLRELNDETDDGTPTATTTTKQIKLPKLDDNDSSDSDNDDEDADLQRAKFENETFYENIQINEDDEKAMERFMSSNPKPRRMLADIIMEKLTEKQTELNSQFSENNDVLQLEEIDPKVRQMYESVGNILKQYRSGKIPKCFKIISTLRNWEQMLYLTNPNNWSAAAMYQATRIFTSNLKENLCQRFFYLVLLPRIRDDLLEYKRLNFHLYQALRKALYKPKAFMKGILLPLCESGNCTLREAIIVGSVIAKNSIPVLPSSAAILKIAEMDYNGANSIFLRIFFDKKYALPYRVIDGVVFHFLRFRFDSRELPVLWHQALLTFVQRYKSDISSEQKENLLELLKKHEHYQITPEIRRELQNSKCRDVEIATPQMDFD